MPHQGHCFKLIFSAFSSCLYTCHCHSASILDIRHLCFLALQLPLRLGCSQVENLFFLPHFRLFPITLKLYHPKRANFKSEEKKTFQNEQKLLLLLSCAFPRFLAFFPLFSRLTVCEFTHVRSLTTQEY